MITSSKMSSAPTRVARGAQRLRGTRARARRGPCSPPPARRSRRPPRRRARGRRCKARRWCRRPPRAGHPAEPARPERRHTAAAAGEQRVGVAVVAAGELHDPVATGRAPGEAHRRHRRLGPRRDEAHHLARRARPRRSPRRGSTSPSVGAPKVVPRAGGAPTAASTTRMGVAEDRRAPGLDVVELAAGRRRRRRRRPRPEATK